MNKVEIDGKEYEVLELGSHLFMTHARFSNGEVMEASSCFYPDLGFNAYPIRGNKSNFVQYSIRKATLHSIQPLKLLPKARVEFIGAVPKPERVEVTGVVGDTSHDGVAFWIPLDIPHGISLPEIPRGTKVTVSWEVTE